MNSTPVKWRVYELTQSVAMLPLIHWRVKLGVIPPYLPQMPVGDLTADAAKD